MFQFHVFTSLTYPLCAMFYQLLEGYCHLLVTQVQTLYLSLTVKSNQSPSPAWSSLRTLTSLLPHLHHRYHGFSLITSEGSVPSPSHPPHPHHSTVADKGIFLLKSPDSTTSQLRNLPSSPPNSTISDNLGSTFKSVFLVNVPLQALSPCLALCSLHPNTPVKVRAPPFLHTQPAIVSPLLPLLGAPPIPHGALMSSQWEGPPSCLLTHSVLCRCLSFSSHHFCPYTSDLGTSPNPLRAKTVSWAPPCSPLPLERC